MNAILIIAAIYGSLVSGEFKHAPYTVRIRTPVPKTEEWRKAHPTFTNEYVYVTRVTSTLKEDVANSLGYRRLIDEPPACVSNEYVEATGYTEASNRIYRVYEKKWEPVAARKFSKLSIYAAITKLNAWPTVQAWLEAKQVDGMNGWMAFQLAQEISDAHPMFKALSEEARVLLGLSQEQFDAMLDACILKED